MTCWTPVRAGVYGHLLAALLCLPLPVLVLAHAEGVAYDEHFLVEVVGMVAPIFGLGVAGVLICVPALRGRAPRGHAVARFAGAALVSAALLQVLSAAGLRFDRTLPLLGDDYPLPFLGALIYLGPGVVLSAWLESRGRAAA